MLSAVYRSTELRINPLAENNLNQAVDHYLQYIEVVRGYSAHTVKNYRRDLSKLIEFCSESCDRRHNPAQSIASSPVGSGLE